MVIWLQKTLATNFNFHDQIKIKSQVTRDRVKKTHGVIPIRRQNWPSSFDTLEEKNEF